MAVISPEVEFGHEPPSAESHLYVLSTPESVVVSSAIAGYLSAR